MAKGELWQAMFTFLVVVFACHVVPDPLRAEPQPRDVFREYRWTNAGADAGGALRVGGKVGYGGTNIQLQHSFDLQHATRAEVVIEKLLCHAGTKKLELSVNDHPWILIPESPGIPKPQCDYQHHTYPTVSVPVSQFRTGENNCFRMRVDNEHPWSWPQNLIYGVHFRIYYDASLKQHPSGRIIAPSNGDTVGRIVDLQVQASSPNAEIERVDFFGEYADVNLEGDGRYHRWHYHYIKSTLTGHLGTRKQTPWNLQWDTSWVPDQPQSFRVAAWVSDSTGLTFCTDTVDELKLSRGGLTVELCKPYDVPKKWVTRSGEHSERVRIDGDLSSAVCAKLVWCSWSPGYMEGVFVNDHLILQREGPRYAYYLHHVPIEDLSLLKTGENTIKTGKTPKYHAKTVHGMEVNWPGIMLLIQYQAKDQAKDQAP